jgi:hypothetical protein
VLGACYISHCLRVTRQFQLNLNIVYVENFCFCTINWILLLFWRTYVFLKSVCLKMPPKKTTPVAIQKCGRCFKKHAPPLGDQCLALLLGEPGSATNAEQDKEFVDNSNTVDAPAPETEPQGAVGGPLPEKDQGNCAVAAQLANLTAVVSHLAGLFEVTRKEVSSLRSEVAAVKSARTVTTNNGATSSDAPSMAPIMAMSVPSAPVSASSSV